MKRSILTTLCLTLFLASCAHKETYSFYTSKDGSNWELFRENISEQLAQRQVNGSCVMQIWGPQHHSVKYINNSTGETTTKECEEVFAEQQRASLAEEKPPLKYTKEQSDFWK